MCIHGNHEFFCGPCIKAASDRLQAYRAERGKPPLPETSEGFAYYPAPAADEPGWDANGSEVRR